MRKCSHEVGHFQRSEKNNILFFCFCRGVTKCHIARSKGFSALGECNSLFALRKYDFPL